MWRVERPGSVYSGPASWISSSTIRLTLPQASELFANQVVRDALSGEGFSAIEDARVVWKAQRSLNIFEQRQLPARQLGA